jgi:hypothetical protein
LTCVTTSAATPPYSDYLATCSESRIPGRVGGSHLGQTTLQVAAVALIERGRDLFADLLGASDRIRVGDERHPLGGDKALLGREELHLRLERPTVGARKLSGGGRPHRGQRHQFLERYL